jgi:hypothetical protein
MIGMRFAEMRWQNAAGAVEPAFLDFVLERRHVCDILVILDCRAVGGDARRHLFDPRDPAELLLDAPIVQHGGHSADVQRSSFHVAFLCSIRSSISYRNYFIIESGRLGLV